MYDLQFLSHTSQQKYERTLTSTLIVTKFKVQETNEVEETLRSHLLKSTIV